MAKAKDDATDAPVEGAPTADQGAGDGGTQHSDATIGKNPEVDEASGNQLPGNAPDGLALTAEEAAEARKEGAKEAAKESAKDTYTFLTDGNLPGDPPVNRFLGSDDIMQFAHLLDQSPDEFNKTVAADREPPLGEEKVAGLYKLERNGQNRTPYVKALRDRLGLKKGEDVPGAGGPPWTNDITNTTEL